MGSILETVMLICFGCSWPINVVKAYRARTAKGTSLLFILLILTGYIGGISAKILAGAFNYVFVVYIINILMVLANLAVYFRNVALDKGAQTVDTVKERFPGAKGAVVRVHQNG